MAWYLVLVILMLKHLLVVHLVDAGYSWSRSPTRQGWVWGLILHSATELTVTCVALMILDYRVVLLALAAESTALIIACLLEREARYYNLIRMHVTGEIVVLLTYLSMAICLR